MYEYSVIIDPFGGGEVVLTILADDPPGCVDRLAGGVSDRRVAFEHGVFEGYRFYAGQGVEHGEVEGIVLVFQLVGHGFLQSAWCEERFGGEGEGFGFG